MRRTSLSLVLAACASPGGSGQRLELETEARDAPVTAPPTGKGVVDGVEATLEFVSDSAVSGNGSCNRFRGPVTVSRGTISFGALAATRMFCGEAVTNQETEYLAALGAAERWEIEEPILRIYAAGRPEPLRFVGR